MKILLPFILATFAFLSVATAQTPTTTDENKSTAPPRTVTNAPAANPAVTEAQLTLKRYTLVSNRLREAYAAKDAATINAFYPGLLNNIRQGIDQFEQRRIAVLKAIAPPPTATETSAAAKTPTEPTPAEIRVKRGREILAAFEGFEFKAENAEEAEAKFALVAEFQRLLQENLNELKK